MASTVSMPASAEYLVYIGGVRVPAKKVTVTSGRWQPVSAVIELPPHRLLARLGAEDRLQVAAFYLDSWYEPDDQRWCLLFEGHITGFSYTTQQGQSAVSIEVQSNLAVLQSLFFNLVSGSGVTSKTLAKSDKDYPNQLVMRGKFPQQLFTDELSGRAMARPFDIIENIFRIVLGPPIPPKGSGSSTPSTEATKAEIDAFKSTIEAQKTARLSQIIEAAAVGMAGEGFEGKPDAAQLEENKNDLIQEYTEKLTASMDAALRANLRGMGVKSTDSMDPNTLAEEYAKRMAKAIKERKAAQSTSVSKTGFYSRFMRLTRFVEHWVAAPYVEGIPRATDPLRGRLGGGAFPLLRATKAQKMLKQIGKTCMGAARRGAPGGGKGKGQSVWGLVQMVFSLLYYEVTEVMAPPILMVDKYGLPSRAFNLSAADTGSYFTEAETSGLETFSQEEMDDLYKAWAEGISGGERPCIGSFHSKPETYFSAPPACNVVFPSMVRQLTYSENYVAQPTRLYFNRRSNNRKLNLASSQPGWAHDGNRVGYPGVAIRHAQDAAKKGVNDLELLIFPEEYYRGPNPVIEDIHPLLQDMHGAAAAGRWSNPVVGSSQQAVSAVDAVSAPFAFEAAQKAYKEKMPAYSTYFLVAQQEFYKRRLAVRGGQVSCLFHPYMVPSYPVCLFDATQTGIHLMAMADSITHILEPTSAATVVTYSHAQTLEEMLKSVAAQSMSGLDYSPQMPIPELRDLLQNVPAANTYYSLIFRLAEQATGRGEVKSLAGAGNIALLGSEKAAAQEAEGILSQEVVKLGDEVAFLEQSASSQVIAKLSAKDKERLEEAKKEYKVASKKLGKASSNLAKINRKLLLAESDRAGQFAEEGALDKNEAEGTGSILDHGYTISEALESFTLGSAVFDYKKFFGWYMGKGAISPILSSTQLEAATAGANWDDSNYMNPDQNHADWASAHFDDLEGAPSVLEAIQARLKLVPLPGTSEFICTNPEMALGYCSRPVCTLEEYIDFYAVAGRGADNLEPEGRGRGTRFNFKKSDTLPMYYDAIRQFISGPGVEPGSKVGELGVETAASKIQKIKAHLEEGETLDQMVSFDMRASLKYAEEKDVRWLRTPLRLSTINRDGRNIEIRVVPVGEVANFYDLPDCRLDWQELLLDYLNDIENPAPMGGTYKDEGLD